MRKKKKISECNILYFHGFNNYTKKKLVFTEYSLSKPILIIN